MGQYIQTFTLNQRTVTNTSAICLLTPLHIKTSIPYSQALRVSRICSSEKDFKMHVSHIKIKLIKLFSQIDKVVLGRDSLLRKIWKVGFLLLLPCTLMLKSLENWLGTYFLFYKVMQKFKSFSHLLRSYLTEAQEK